MGDLPCGPVVKTLLPLQRELVRSLVGELRSHKLHGVAKKKRNEVLTHAMTSMKLGNITLREMSQ